MRRLAIFALAFSAGIFLSQYVLPVSWLVPCAFLAFALACGALLLPGDWRKRLLLAGVGLSLAFGYDWLYVRQVQRPMEALADTEGMITAVLQDYAVSTSYGAKVTVKLEGLLGRAVFYGDETLLDLSPGQTIESFVRFQSASRIRDDDVTTFTSKGIFLLAYGRGEAVYGTGSSASPRWWPVRLGRAMGEMIEELFPKDSSGFLRAILTGDKSGISESAGILMSQTGMYHIMAVSGMHCMFLLSMVTALFGRHRRRLVAAWALPLLGLYALLTGGSPSVVRACIMMVFLLAAPLFRRESDSPTALATALFLILLVNPFAAASISLQLSFAAMAGLLWLTPRLNKCLTGSKKHRKLYRFTATGFSATMGALVFTAPLSGLYFNTMVLVSPVSNLLCLWAASAAFIAGLLAVLLGFLWAPLGLLAGLVPRGLIWYILSVLELLARLPWHAVSFSNPYLKYWLAYVYLLFAAAWLLRSGTRRKYVLAAALSLAALAATVKLNYLRYDREALNILALDVGQGQSVLLASGGVCALVDCGSGNSWYDPGQAAADQLESMGFRRLDYLILTHYDSDHVNGVTALLERIPVDLLLVPEAPDDGGMQALILAAAGDHGTDIRFLREIQTALLGGSILTIYPPVGAARDNERGLAVLCSAGEFDLLITGDMDSATERQLLAAYPLPDIEVLMVGHHGSKYSTSKELLDALRPETAMISVGANSYGHPAEETLRRLAEAGAEIYRTDMQGQIHLTVN